MQLLDRASLAPLLDGWGQSNSDFLPILDLGVEKNRYFSASASGFVGLSASRFDLTAPFARRRLAPSQNGSNPIALNPRLEARALAARLREAHGKPVPTATDRALAEALQRSWSLQTSFLSNGPPSSWRIWLADVIRAEGDAHRGTAGDIDREFYAPLREYLARTDPPAEVRGAVDFVEALAGWDFTTAAGAADLLLRPAIVGESWIPVDLLRDGAVVAKILTGDVAGARYFFEALRGRSERSPDDLRSRLLQAFLSRGEASGPGSIMARP
jgi:hypothetical protein